MGVELRSIQRKFNSLMGEVQPQIKPRFMVWLDERLAEFKIKGSMDLGETLEDPQWIKDYYKSKRDAKAAAIQKRENKTNSSSGGGSIHPKLETKSESSNGHAHPDELEGKLHEEKIESSERQPIKEKSDEQQESNDQFKDTGFQLVEVKQEQIEDDDDDMIIVGESIASQPESYQTYVNPTRHTFTGFGNRTVGGFHRKRQRFGMNAPRPFVSFSNRRLKSHARPNFRNPSATNIQENTLYPSHTDSSASLPMFTTTPATYTDDNSQGYDTGGDGGAYSQYYSQSESLRLPEHLQTHSSNVLMTESEPYTEGGDEMYADYGEESYDSSYMVESAETSLQYDQEGNPVIKGDQTTDETSMEPLPGTSNESNRQAIGAIDLASIYGSHYRIPAKKRFPCHLCLRSFAYKSGLNAHINFYHFGKTRYICPYCSKIFPATVNLQLHLKRAHLDRL